MKTIRFNEMEIFGVRSFERPEKVYFSKNPGLKFVGGDNKVDPLLGANGAGKSSIWEALVACLYGVSVRGRRINTLINNQTGRLNVRLFIEVNGVEYVIERAAPPSKLTINEEAAIPEDIELLLGLSYQQFMSSVVFGQAVAMFADLPVPDRGALFDSIMDLGVWVAASQASSITYKRLNTHRTELENQISYKQGELSTLQSEQQIKEEIARWEENYAKGIETALATLAEGEQLLESLLEHYAKQREICSTLSEISDAEVEALRAKESELVVAKARLVTKIEYAEKRLDFYIQTKGKTCPECKQLVSEEHVDQVLDQIGNSLTTFLRDNKEVVTKLAQISAELAIKRKDLMQERQCRSTELGKLENLSGQIEQLKNSLEASAERVEAQIDNKPVNPHIARLAEVEATKTKIQSALEQLQHSKASLVREMELADFWAQGFKRVRFYIVKRVLTYLNLEVNAAARELGLDGWDIEFATEIETKSGTLRPGIHIQVSSPTMRGSWEDWSGGEGQRIRIAVSIGLASLIQKMAGVSFDLEVWDEPSAWLSPEGIESLLNCLHQRALTCSKSIMLCDHRALTYSGFSEIWIVHKEAGGSTIERSLRRA